MLLSRGVIYSQDIKHVLETGKAIPVTGQQGQHSSTKGHTRFSVAVQLLAGIGVIVQKARDTGDSCVKHHSAFEQATIAMAANGEETWDSKINSMTL
eukprot:365748-Chlamydomonas_euryale.AAC.5